MGGQRIERVDVEGPIHSLFCPVCCNGDRYQSVYSLRSHVKEQHSDDMKNRCWEVTRGFISGDLSIEEFYDAVDERTPEVIEEFEKE